MATGFSKKISNFKKQHNRNRLTLPQLLDESQPYEQLSRLCDDELSGLGKKNQYLSKIQGSLIGLAVGDALGASVEFRPHSYMVANPVSDMTSGGTWSLNAGQWTDDTSMALCLAASLISKGGFDAYDQLVRYKRWFRKGYMSSTGICFDIGASTRQAIIEFETRQHQSAQILKEQQGFTVKEDCLDKEIGEKRSELNFNTDCGKSDAAGNGALMRLAPIPLFYFRSMTEAVQHAANSVKTTHGDQKAIDACQFYGELIWHAINGVSKRDLLSTKLFQKYLTGNIDKNLMEIIKGSYKNRPNGYDDGIRGKGFILNSLEAALWALCYDNNSFEKGVLLAVNLGDDTDTTAAIYGQLAGAIYGIDEIPKRWRDQLFQANFLLTLANGLYAKGKNLNLQKRKSTAIEDDEEISSSYKTRRQGSSDGKKQPNIIPEFR
ncbi:unnamed protein product [Rotaria socialis]|uniref:ADP-ribosylglycohydrolase n=1 Tax=Rotaria socialis TaxID=392032 RepID=A0A821GXG3_9BILA|nr:unnamed protein product [Rotaria socialis]CAF3408375.1 unnamed protein product [Rotaria socialis]CAF3435646.1 unnamed protein product [Rotaria socialis]CAF3655747.1 unnamed protein product [Rotaria socialis]CAF4401821.1 unnamed protein product [Rotaria socialis]